MEPLGKETPVSPLEVRQVSAPVVPKKSIAAILDLVLAEESVHPLLPPKDIFPYLNLSLQKVYRSPRVEIYGVFPFGGPVSGGEEVEIHFSLYSLDRPGEPGFNRKETVRVIRGYHQKSLLGDRSPNELSAAKLSASLPPGRLAALRGELEGIVKDNIKGDIRRLKTKLGVVEGVAADNGGVAMGSVRRETRGRVVTERPWLRRAPGARPRRVVRKGAVRKKRRRKRLMKMTRVPFYLPDKTKNPGSKVDVFFGKSPAVVISLQKAIHYYSKHLQKYMHGSWDNCVSGDYILVVKSPPATHGGNVPLSVKFKSIPYKGKARNGYRFYTERALITKEVSMTDTPKEIDTPEEMDGTEGGLLATVRRYRWEFPLADIRQFEEDNSHPSHGVVGCGEKKNAGVLLNL